LFRPRFETLEDRTVPSNITFSNPQGGDWGITSNWDLNRLPTAGDTAIITRAGIQVTYASPDTQLLTGLTLNGDHSFLHVQAGTIQVTGALAMSNNFTTTVDGGTLFGQETFTVASSTLTVNSGTVSAPNDNLTISGSTLTLHGGSVPFTTTLVNSTLDLGDNSTTGAGRINVQGTSTSIGNVSAGQTVVVQAQNGVNAVLIVAAGATNAGTIQLESQFSASAFLTAPTTGAFTNAVGGVIRAANGTRQVTGNVVNQGSVAANPGAALTFSNGTLEMAGGTVTGSCAVVSSQVRVTASPVAGTAITVEGISTLQGDNLAGTTIVVEAQNGITAVLTVTPGASNAGTIIVESGFSARANLSIPSGTLTNTGSLVINPGTSFITGELVNEGTVIVNTSFTLGGIAGVENYVNTGTWNIANGASVTVRGNSFVNQPQGVITGTGIMDFSTQAGELFTNLGTILVPAGTLQVKGTFVNFHSFEQTLVGGTYDVTGTFRFDGANIVTNAANIILRGAAAQVLPATGTTSALANFATNRADGTIAIRNGHNFTTANGVSVFDNEGTLTAGQGSTFRVLHSYTQGSGAMLVVDRGRLRIDGSFTNVAAGTLTGGQYQIIGTDPINIGVLQFSGANITTNTATLDLDGPGAAVLDESTTPLDGLRNFATNNGSFFLLNGRNFSTTGDWSNSGSLTVGASSTLAVNGNFTQTGAGFLNVQLGGTAPGQFSQLTVTGMATLDGALNVTETGGFTPAAGNTFQFLPFGSRTGDFAAKTGFQLGNGLFLREDMNATDLTLEAFQAQLAFQQQPTDTAAGQTITPFVRVAIVDPSTGMAIAYDGSDTITLALGGGGTLGGTVTKTVSSGVATFDNLSINQSGSGYTLTASSMTSPALTSATSNSFAINPAAADHLLFFVQPMDTPAGQTINEVVVEVVDQFGNLVTSESSATVTLSLTPGGGSGMLSSSGGMLTMTFMNGRATVNDLSIDMAESYMLHAAISSGLPDINSNPFNIT
jgi:hypothetical protein